MDRKYILTDETKIYDGRTLYRIKAVKDVGLGLLVKAGDLGGFVEGEHNLSHEGLCWVHDNAIVYDNARVYGDASINDNAMVYDFAEVFGGANIYGNAQIFGKAYVYGDAEITDYARVFGDAVVCDDARVYGDADVYGDAYVHCAASLGWGKSLYGTERFW